MKRRGIIERLNEIKCGLTKHEYEYIECGSAGGKRYFLYRCRGCGKNKIIFCMDIIEKMEEVDPVKAIGYPIEKFVIPGYFFSIDHVFESREAGYLISRYWEKEGVLISAYGNRRERNF